MDFLDLWKKFRRITKNTPLSERVSHVAGRAGFENLPLNEGPRTENKKRTPLRMRFPCGGEGGIRTRDRF